MCPSSYLTTERAPCYFVIVMSTEMNGDCTWQTKVNMQTRDICTTMTVRLAMLALHNTSISITDSILDLVGSLLCASVSIVPLGSSAASRLDAASGREQNVVLEVLTFVTTQVEVNRKLVVVRRRNCTLLSGMILATYPVAERCTSSDVRGTTSPHLQVRRSSP